MPDLYSVVNFFPTPFENSVTMTLGGSISPGATTVPVNGMSNYSDGDIVVFNVDAATPALMQVFTGTVSGSDVVNVVWTYGTNQPHSTGASVVDYVSSSTVGMISKGIQVQHAQSGDHIGVTNTGGMTTDTLDVTGSISGAGYNVNTIANSCKFLVYRATAFSSAILTQEMPFDTTLYDTGSNCDVATNKGRFTAPVAGFYQFSFAISFNVGTSTQHYLATLYKNGSEVARGTELELTVPSGFLNFGVTVTPPLLQLAANDYIEPWFNNTVSNNVNVGDNPLQTYFGGYLACRT